MSTTRAHNPLAPALGGRARGIPTTRCTTPSTTPDGSSSPTRCPNGARYAGDRHDASAPENLSTGFTSGWSATSRRIGGSERHSPRRTGSAAGATALPARRNGHTTLTAPG